jgi:hypothetical protein
MMVTFVGSQMASKRARISWAILIFLLSEVRKPPSLYRAPCTWAIGNAYQLSVYTLITLSFPYL